MKSFPFLQQILWKLKQNGFVESVRGKYRGYKLAKDISEISVDDVAVAISNEDYLGFLEGGENNERG